METGEWSVMHPRSTGQLIDASVRFYRRCFRGLMAVELVISVPSLLFIIAATDALPWLFEQLDFSIRNPIIQMPTTALIALILLVPMSVLMVWKEGALIRLIQAYLTGEKMPWQMAYRTTFRQWPALWFANLIPQIGRWFTLAEIPLLLILSDTAFDLIQGYTYALVVYLQVPAVTMIACSVISLSGLFLLVTWWLNKPAIVMEHVNAWHAYGRAFQLSKRWRIRLVGRLVTFDILQFVAVVAPFWLVEFLLLLLLEQMAYAPWMSVLVQWSLGFIVGVTSLLVSPLATIYMVLNYYDMRVRKEDLDLEMRLAHLALNQNNAVNIESRIPNP